MIVADLGREELALLANFQKLTPIQQEGILSAIDALLQFDRSQDRRSNVVSMRPPPRRRQHSE